MNLLRWNADPFPWKLGASIIALTILSVEMTIYIMPSLDAALKSGNPYVWSTSPLVACSEV